MDKTLVILAAGMGSRFGGLKQIEPVGPNGEIIADYSVYDALRCGFTKVVFIIKKENLSFFQNNIVNKYQNKIKVEFGFQSLDDFQDKIPDTRTKMLGTAHALYCAKDIVKEPFVMINADDFYGFESFVIANHFLNISQDDYEYLSVSYPFINSTTAKDKVNRGLIKEENGIIKDIDECSIEIKNEQVLATNLQNHTTKIIPSDAPVAMNFFAFKPTIFKLIDQDLKEFLKEYVNETNELILTDTLKKNIQNKNITVKTILTPAHWLGVTYRKDLEYIKSSLEKLVNDGIYPKNLWR